MSGISETRKAHSVIYDALRPSSTKVVCLALILILAGATLWAVGKAKGLSPMKISGHVITGLGLAFIGVSLLVRCSVNIRRCYLHGR